MNPEVPPPNRAIGWYRFMLWTLPWSIAVSTWLGTMWLEYRFGGTEGLWFLVWLAVNLTATVGIGVFDERLKASRTGELLPTSRVVVARFVFLQIFIIPWFAMAVLFAACLVVEAIQ